MQVDIDRLIMTLKKIDLVREELAKAVVGKLEPSIRVMDLKFVVEDMYGLNIEMIEVDFPAEHLRGHILRYDDKRAKIIVRSSLSNVEKRHTAVKELCHLVLDEEEDFSVDGASIVDTLIEDAVLFSTNGVGLEDPSKPEQSELLAILAAGELMYPREYHDADRRKLAQEETTIAAIALQHGVPPYLIQHCYRTSSIIDTVREHMANPKAEAAE